MGTYTIFRHGDALCGAQHGDIADVQRHGYIRHANHLLDRIDYAALDIKAYLESVP